MFSNPQNYQKMPFVESMSTLWLYTAQSNITLSFLEQDRKSSTLLQDKFDCLKRKEEKTLVAKTPTVMMWKLTTTEHLLR